DLKRRQTIRDSWIASRCGWTPYDGKTVIGWPVGTIVRGARASRTARSAANRLASTSSGHDSTLRVRVSRTAVLNRM
ncbi:MAG: hypothetical protein ACHQX4_07755, partial [Gemmatimonadales bacterium]